MAINPIKSFASADARTLDLPATPSPAAESNAGASSFARALSGRPGARGLANSVLSNSGFPEVVIRNRGGGDWRNKPGVRRGLAEAMHDVAAAFLAFRRRRPDPVPLQFLEHPPADDNVLDSARRTIEGLRHMGYTVNENIVPTFDHGVIRFGNRFNVYTTQLAGNPPPPDNFAYRAVRHMERLAYTPNGAYLLSGLLAALETSDMNYHWQPHMPGGPSTVHTDGSRNIWLQYDLTAGLLAQLPNPPAQVVEDLRNEAFADAHNTTPEVTIGHEWAHGLRIARHGHREPPQMPPTSIVPGGEPIDYEEDSATGLSPLSIDRLGTENGIRRDLNVLRRRFYRSRRELERNGGTPTSPPDPKPGSSPSKRDLDVQDFWPFSTDQEYAEGLRKFIELTRDQKTGAVNDHGAAAELYKRLVISRVSDIHELIDDETFAQQIVDQSDEDKLVDTILRRANETVIEDINQPYFTDYVRNGGEQRTLELAGEGLSEWLSVLFPDRTGEIPETPPSSPEETPPTYNAALDTLVLNLARSLDKQTTKIGHLDDPALGKHFQNAMLLQLREQQKANKPISLHAAFVEVKKGVHAHLGAAAEREGRDAPKALSLFDGYINSDDGKSQAAGQAHHAYQTYLTETPHHAGEIKSDKDYDDQLNAISARLGGGIIHDPHAFPHLTHPQLRALYQNLIAYQLTKHNGHLDNAEKKVNDDLFARVGNVSVQIGRAYPEGETGIRWGQWHWEWNNDNDWLHYHIDYVFKDIYWEKEGGKGEAEQLAEQVYDATFVTPKAPEKMPATYDIALDDLAAAMADSLDVQRKRMAHFDDSPLGQYFQNAVFLKLHEQNPVSLHITFNTVKDDLRRRFEVAAMKRNKDPKQALEIFENYLKTEDANKNTGNSHAAWHADQAYRKRLSEFQNDDPDLTKPIFTERAYQNQLGALATFLAGSVIHDPHAFVGYEHELLATLYKNLIAYKLRVHKGDLDKARDVVNGEVDKKIEAAAKVITDKYSNIGKPWLIKWVLDNHWWPGNGGKPKAEALAKEVAATPEGRTPALLEPEEFPTAYGGALEALTKAIVNSIDEASETMGSLENSVLGKHFKNAILKRLHEHHAARDPISLHIVFNEVKNDVRGRLEGAAKARGLNTAKAFKTFNSYIHGDDGKSKAAGQADQAYRQFLTDTPPKADLIRTKEQQDEQLNTLAADLAGGVIHDPHAFIGYEHDVLAKLYQNLIRYELTQNRGDVQAAFDHLNGEVHKRIANAADVIVGKYPQFGKASLVEDVIHIWWEKGGKDKAWELAQKAF